MQKEYFTADSKKSAIRDMVIKVLYEVEMKTTSKGSGLKREHSQHKEHSSSSKETTKRKQFRAEGDALMKQDQQLKLSNVLQAIKERMVKGNT